LALSIDVRAQFAVRAAVGAAARTYGAKAGVGLLLDVRTGELAALVSLPEFDPVAPGAARPEARFNNATLGVFEMGSTFKIFTTAIALQTGVVDLTGSYDASDPIEAYGHEIRDFHPRGRQLSVPEIFKYSSNIGSAKMALDFGVDAQRAWLDALGLTTAPPLEVAEVGRPLVPNPWRPINLMTIAYGHGLSVSPVQLASAVAAVVNGGIYRPPTLLKQDGPVAGRRVFSSEISADMRRLMRLSVVEGTGRRADAAGYFVGGKTGSAEKIVDGAYDPDRMVSSFVGAFPMDAPRYVVFAMLDEPQGTAETNGNATGGWTAAPIARAIVEAAAPILGVEPRLSGDAAAVAALAIDAGGPPLEETPHAPF
ncbi:MAG: penicillin-binding protein 2, partial [Pseudomonadota bacterium]